MRMRYSAALIVGLIASCGACGNENHPPDRYSIDASFSAAEQDTIRSAVDAWCAAVGWCPEESPDGALIELVDTLTPEGEDLECQSSRCAVGGVNTGDGVRIARDAGLGLDGLWMTVAHEIGHFCGDGHTESGLMAERATSWVLEVDAVAIEAWHDGCAR